MRFVFNDGGRCAAGFKGHAGDCVCRSVAIASGRPYREVYDALAAGNAGQRKGKAKGNSGRRSARDGIYTQRQWFKDYMRSLGFRWVPTMTIGSGCKVHLTDGELPVGRLVVAVSRHYTAVLDGVIHDTHDPQRETVNFVPDTGRELKPGEGRNQNGIFWTSRRCVYGYWLFAGDSGRG